jgi:hypothetical protein
MLARACLGTDPWEAKIMRNEFDGHAVKTEKEQAA